MCRPLGSWILEVGARPLRLDCASSSLESVPCPLCNDEDRGGQTQAMMNAKERERYFGAQNFGHKPLWQDTGAASHHWRKKTQEQPVTLRGRGSRSTQTLLEPETSPAPKAESKAEMGRRQCKSTYNNMKNNTSPESSPPPTRRPEHCYVDKAEENDLKNSLMNMIEEALEGKMKNAIKEIKEKTNKKLEEMNKEIEDKNKKWKK
ncbi:hypothetical protein STEG23_013884 [Scotinomys teguina]